MVDEDRDTTHPGMVSEFFNGFLTANGTAVSSVVVGKNTREDVLWSEAKLPWRRSPIWLLLRVSLQLSCAQLTGSVQRGNKLYKQAMLFFMSYILKASKPLCLRTELLHVMRAKLSWRLQKLGDEIDADVLECIRVVIENNASITSQRWGRTLEKNAWSIDPTTLSNLDFDGDRPMSLPDLDNFITAITNRKKNAVDAAFRPKTDIVLYRTNTLPSGFGDRSKDDVVIQNLHGFETWVEQNLPSWLETHQDDSSACSQLAKLIRQYHVIAMERYAGAQEPLSVMILVLLELWIACDRIAIAICPMLDNYCPGIPDESLQNLLLPFKGQMARLHHVETYLTTRARSLRSSEEVFQANDSPDCFAARYSDQSIDLQALMERIEGRAKQARKEKLEQLASLKAKYEKLMTRYKQSQCDYYEVENQRTGWMEKRHSPSRCTSCGYKTQAEALQIEVHEWPLPDDSTWAKVVTFELQVPSSFGHWRDSTAYLILDVLKSEYGRRSSSSSPHRLSGDKQLKSLFVNFQQGRSQRIELLSSTKPHIGTHRRGKQISTSTEENVCLRSGLKYHYHDSVTGCFVDAMRRTDKIPLLCTYKLPSEAIRKYIFRPARSPNGPPPNTIIAEQSKCPQQMTLSQWKAVGAMALGYHLQYRNVAMQLRMPVVDFKNLDTVLVVLQCIHQAGPPSDSGDRLRLGHQVAGTEHFAHVMLEQLDEALERIRQNWESSYALYVFTAIARRFLSLNPDESIRGDCMRFLRGARAIAFDWIKVLQGKADEAEPNLRGEYVSKAVEVALICASTLDIDRQYLNTALASTRDASILIQCCIIIHQGGRSLCPSTTNIVALLHSRHVRLLFDAFPTLAENQEALHNAVLESWASYQPGENWTVAENAPHWVVTHTASTAGSDVSIVHYDLLSGSLLVDGQPLGRLPSEYEERTSYGRLFGHSTIEVMPANAAGLRFSAKAHYFGYAIQFGLAAAHNSSASDLLVQASKDSTGTIYELLPPRLFQDEVPTSFVHDFVHWYNCSTGNVEFRPANEPWTISSRGEWRLMKGDDSKWWFVQPSNERFLVAATSPTACTVARILSPLAQPSFIHLTLPKTLSCLDVKIPNLRLRFTLERGSTNLHSRDFPRMYVSKIQSLGTLIGFRSKLLLTHKHTGEQKLFLLEGQTSCRNNIDSRDSCSEPLEDHVDVEVDRGRSCKVHCFDLDRKLGKLVDNGSMQSKLVLAYLHACTASCEPDPLTQRTGTEEALAILESSAVKSFSKLRPENIDILVRIGELTPKWVSYPEYERVMQSVQWFSQLSFMSQHAGFYTNVVSMLDHAKKYDELFFQSDVIMPVIGDVNAHLLERGRIRSAALYISGYGAEKHTSQYDEVHSPRDRNLDSRRRTDAYVFSSHISQRRETCHSGHPSATGLWEVLQRAPPVFGREHRLDLSQIKYDAILVQKGGSLISQAWLALHRTLGERGTVNEFSLMLWLSAIACSEVVDKSALETIAMFHTSSRFRDIRPPQVESFNVSAGYQVLYDQLLQDIRRSLRTFHESPEARLLKHHRESRSDFGMRRYNLFQVHQNTAIQYFASALQEQWPCKSPRTPETYTPVEFNSYIDVQYAMQMVQSSFTTWPQNWELFQYLQSIERAVVPLPIHKVAARGQALPSPQFCYVRPRFISITDLFARQAPSLRRAVHPLTTTTSVVENEWDTSPLKALVAELERDAGSSAYEKRYVEGLKTSVSCLPSKTTAEKHQIPSYEMLRAHWQSCEEQERSFYNSLKRCVLPNQSDRPVLELLRCSQQWPRVSPKFFLQQLRRHEWSKLSMAWKTCIVEYAIAVTLCHQAERLLEAFRTGGSEDVIRELQNEGHTNWDPMEYPERLLLEADSKILIRDVQSDVAKEMENPLSGANISMQLNMGEGKSSVIAPIVAAALADGSRLVRIIVGKAQSKQMAQMLISKLGGMVGRCIYFMPFSRKIRLTERSVERMRNLYRECMDQGGILLLQPEHVLSFQLMGLERYISGEIAIGQSLSLTQQFFNQSTRDVVDESDENFSTKFELINSMGTQRHIDASPDR